MNLKTITFLIVIMVNTNILLPISSEAHKRVHSHNRVSHELETIADDILLPNKRPYGGTLVWGTVHKPEAMSPVYTQSSISATLIALVFDSLIKIDSNGKLMPGLAHSWDVSEDKLVYTFHLNKNVKFHDGVELTAEDVKFTYEVIRSPSNKSPFRGHFESVDKFIAVDKHTFQVVLKKPYPLLIFKMVRYILPKHLYKDKDLKTTDLNYSPIGTGSFQIKGWDRETNQMLLVANKSYFNDRPYLDEIIIKSYSNNNDLWSAVMRREVDFVQRISHKDYSIIEDDETFSGHFYPSIAYYAIAYNLKDSVWGKKRMRKALANTINVRGIIDGFERFDGRETTGPFHPEFIGFNETIEPIQYNPINAKLEFMREGWQDRNADLNLGEYKVRQKNGKNLELRMIVNERNNVLKKMTKIIRQQLSEVGVQLKVLFYKDQSELTEEFFAEHKPQAWLRMYLGLGVDISGPVEGWSSSNYFSDIWEYKNARVNDLFEMGSLTEDKKKREEIYKEIHSLIYEDQPACFLFYPAYYFVVNSRFKNTQEYFSFYMPTYTIKDWYYSEN